MGSDCLKRQASHSSLFLDRTDTNTLIRCSIIRIDHKIRQIEIMRETIFNRKTIPIKTMFISTFSSVMSWIISKISSWGRQKDDHPINRTQEAINYFGFRNRYIPGFPSAERGFLRGNRNAVREHSLRVSPLSGSFPLFWPCRKEAQRSAAPPAAGLRFPKRKRKVVCGNSPLNSSLHR